jgi:hypothetical protein
MLDGDVQVPIQWGNGHSRVACEPGCADMQPGRYGTGQP